MLQGHADTGFVLLDGHRLGGKLHLNTVLGEVLAKDPFVEILAHCYKVLVYPGFESAESAITRVDVVITSGRSGVMGGSSSIFHVATGSVPPGSLYLCMGGKGIPSRLASS